MRRTPAELVRMGGRAALWCLVAVLLFRGAADVLASDERGRAVVRERSSAAGWPDDGARAFAVEFARAYLTYSPRRPAAYARRLRRLVVPELAGSVVPRVAARGPRQVAGSAVVSGVERVDGLHALVTVATTVEAGGVSVRHVTVPVARDGAGGLVVYDLPSLAAPPATADVRVMEGEPLSGAERAELDDVLGRFFAAFLAGQADELRYFAAPGERFVALAVPHELVGLDSVAALDAGGSRARSVLVGLRARDPGSRAVFALRYRVELVRGDRWYVADVNSISEKER